MQNTKAVRAKITQYSDSSVYAPKIVGDGIIFSVNTSDGEYIFKLKNNEEVIRLLKNPANMHIATVKSVSANSAHYGFSVLMRQPA